METSEMMLGIPQSDVPVPLSVQSETKRRLGVLHAWHKTKAADQHKRVGELKYALNGMHEECSDRPRYTEQIKREEDLMLFHIEAAATLAEVLK